MPVITKTPVCHGVEYNDKAASLSCVFDTKEEYITHLIRNKEIEKDPHRYDDGLIHLRGTLKVDARVKRGLNWNDVVATSAIIEQGMINRYQYLPKTMKGVKTTLGIPSLELYMLHNNFDTACPNGGYAVSVLRIPEQASHLDFSSVRAKLTLFYGQRIALSHLPQSGNILGLSPRHLEIDCPDAYHVAKQKGCGAEVLNILKPRSIVAACIYRLINRK